MKDRFGDGLIKVEAGPDGVLCITLDRAEKRNALNLAMWSGLVAALDRADLPDVRAVVLSGSGPCFCAGADLKTFGSDQGAGVFAPAQRMSASHDFFRRLNRFRKPVIAAVQGPAVGVGWSLALSCDLTVASEDALFSAPFHARGFIPDGGILWLLQQSLGAHRARDLLLRRPQLTAAGALEQGLVCTVTPPAEMLRTALDLAAKLANGPAETIQLSLALHRRSGSLSYEDFLEAERDAFVLNSTSGNPAEGARAYLEKRAPRFNQLSEEQPQVVTARPPDESAL